MSWKSAWFNKRKVKLVAAYANKRVGREVTWQELCDVKGNGHKFNGGFGGNIYSKLLDAGKQPMTMTNILSAVAGYSKQEANEVYRELQKPKRDVAYEEVIWNGS